MKTDRGPGRCRRLLTLSGSIVCAVTGQTLIFDETCFGCIKEYWRHRND